MLNKENDLKMFYSISEVAEMFNVNESTLRFWEKEFPALAPKKAGRGIRQYQQKDIDLIKLIHHLVKEEGMTIPGARQRLHVNKDNTDKKVEVLERLKRIRQELAGMRDALDSFTYEQVDNLNQNL
ncbi:MAG: MerR family transcriptional regulator [Bacteroidaceae bacterium]|jgi:DNA-binding transcriptional MerR regulator|nr:MerR family transcriptional regulator [Bacteroidaceae bacterium]MBQ8008164.1 MerR family transcriptional regulator [Bacteroidaceae bacterium]